MRTRDYRIRVPPGRARRARDCDRCSGGWITFVNEHTQTGQQQAHWIRRDSGLVFAENRATAAAAISEGVIISGQIDVSTDPGAPVTVFRFAGGQPCFSHPRAARLFAGNREHTRAEDWIEDLGEHVSNLQDRIQRG